MLLQQHRRQQQQQDNSRISLNRRLELIKLNRGVAGAYSRTGKNEFFQTQIKYDK